MPRNEMWLEADLGSFHSLDVIGDHFSLDEARRQADGRQIISMVRNPVDRCISETYRRIRNGNWEEGGEIHPALRYAEEMGSLVAHQFGGEVPDDVMFGVFEQYQESVNRWAEALDWPFVPELPHRNKGENRVEADEETRAKIASCLSEDFAVYDAVVASF